MILSNPNHITFCFKVTTTKNGNIIDLALIRYDANEHVIRINDNWIVHESCIENYFQNKLPNNRSTHGSHTPIASNEPAETMLQVVLNENQFKAGALSVVGMRFNNGHLVKLEFIGEKLSCITFE